MLFHLNREESSLVRYCLLVRGLGFLLTICLSPFPDHEADAFNPPKQPPQNYLDSLISDLFRGYRRWDSIYFSFIAQWNYLYEQSLAFFPLWPCILGFVSRLVHQCVFALVQLDTIILPVGIVLNFTFGCVISVLLYRLGLIVLGSARVSYFAAVLFCLNPALVFFSSLYSESVFFLLTIMALLCYERRQLFRASLFTALSVGCRSNGLLNVGYIGFALLCSDAFGRLIWSEHTILDTKRSFLALLKSTFKWWFHLGITLFPYVFYAVVSVLPLAIYQLYAYLLFCTENVPIIQRFLHASEPPYALINFGQQAQYRFPRWVYTNQTQIPLEPVPSWCLSNLPFSYSHIQKSYWSVSLFGYYQLKQIPNFLLAFPVVLLSLACAAAFHGRAPRTYKTLGLRAETPRDRRLLPYVLHMLFLTIYGVTHINVQVLTRIIFSSCPVIYWYCAYLLCDCPNWHFPGSKDRTKTEVGVDATFRTDLLRLSAIFNPAQGRTRKQRLILLYFVSYALVGTVMHSKFLPWT